MSEKQIFALLRQLWKDVYTPEFYWVLLLLVLVLSLSWWLARCLKNCLPEQAPEEEQSRMRVFGEGGLQRLSYPLFAMILVFSMNKLLAYLGWKCLSLLSLAGTLLLAWTLVRLLVYVLRCVFFRSALLRMFERFIDRQHRT